MAADYNQPTIVSEYTQALDQLRDNINTLSRLIKDDQFSNLPIDSVRFLDGIFSRWDGNQFVVNPISVSGGGTGEKSPAGARGALDVYSTSEVYTQLETDSEIVSGINSLRPLSDSVNLDDSATSASSKAVKDKLSNLPNAKSDATTSTDSNVLATSKAVNDARVSAAAQKSQGTSGIYAGQVNASGSSGTPFPSGWTRNKISTGLYEVTPNFVIPGNMIFMVSLITTGDRDGTISARENGTTSWFIYTGSGGTAVDYGFTFAAIERF